MERTSKTVSFPHTLHFVCTCPRVSSNTRMDLLLQYGHLINLDFCPETSSLEHRIFCIISGVSGLNVLLIVPHLQCSLIFRIWFVQ